MSVGSRHKHIAEELSEILNEIRAEFLPISQEIEKEFGVDLKIDGAITELTNSILENRKVVLGVVGQVNAGKSTLLNCLLFGGREMLTTDVTPATARLTIIKHSEKETEMSVQFYSREEWNGIKALADEEVSKHTIKRPFSDTVHNAEKKLGTELDGLLGTIATPDYLDSFEYINKDGKYVDIVKITEIGTPDPRLTDIEVVDTPGLNDVVESRVKETYKQLERTDAIVLLTSHGKIMDSNDFELALSQIREQGIGKLIVVVPQLDTYGPEQRRQINEIRQDLSDRAERFAKRYGPGAEKIAKEWFTPDNVVTVSAMANVVGSKKKCGSKLTEDEEFYYGKMLEDSEIPAEDPDRLIKWSQIDVLESKIDETVVKNKTAILIGRPLRKLMNDINTITSVVQRHKTDAEASLKDLTVSVAELRNRRKEELDVLGSLDRDLSRLTATFVSGYMGEALRELKDYELSLIETPVTDRVPWGDSDKRILAGTIALELRMAMQDRVRELVSQCISMTQRFQRELSTEFDSVIESMPVNGKYSDIADAYKNELYSHFTSSMNMDEEIRKIQIPEIEFRYSTLRAMFNFMSGSASSRIGIDLDQVTAKNNTLLRDKVYPEIKKKVEGIWNKMVTCLKDKARDLKNEKKSELDSITSQMEKTEESKKLLENEYNRKAELFTAVDVEIERISNKLNVVLSKLEA